MSLNNIELQPYMMADLYATSLIEINATTVPQTVAPGVAAGETAKKVLIVFTDENNNEFSDEQMAFLKTILKACSLQMKDVAIINFQHSAAMFEGLHHAAATVLLFGVGPLTLGLPINFPHYQLQQFNKRTYLYAPPLHEVEKDRDIKAKLWTALKKLFGIH